MTKLLIDGFLERVRQDGTCWVWTGAKNQDEYPRFYLGGGNYMLAHRWSYEHFVGPIPNGLTIDHVRTRGCRFTLCVNPVHLEAVTDRVNILRGDGVCAQKARQVTCIRGHLFDEVNTAIRKDGSRLCRTCHRERNRQARRAA